MSIIFYLNKDLVVFKENVKQWEKLASLERKSRFLNLADNFASFWPEIGIDDEKEIYFIVGEEGGFTDSRIIFVWLQSWKKFYPESNFYIHQTKEWLDFQNTSEIVEILKIAKTENNQNLTYSKEPRIG